jgi:hypothetical protein
MLGGLRSNKTGDIWITAGHGYSASQLILAKYDQNVDGFVKYEFDLERRFIRDFVFDRSSPIIWVGKTQGEGLHSLNLKTKEIVKQLNPSRDSETNSKQNSINSGMDRGSDLLLATSKGCGCSTRKQKHSSGRPVIRKIQLSFSKLISLESSKR